MVFVWVSTGYSEPFVPRTPWTYRVPEIHPNQGVSRAEDDTRFPRNPFENPNPSVSTPHLTRTPLDHTNPIHSYQESQKTHQRGDRIYFVWEIMTEPVDTLKEEDWLEDAKNQFREKRYRHIPIVNSLGKLVGILSDRDILRLMAEGTNLQTTIRGHMVKKVLTTTPDSSIRDAAYVLVSEKIGCLPVISPEQKPVGILTRSDILKTIFKKPPLDLFA